LGFKSKWLDDAVLVNMAVFRSDYRDLQVNSGVFIPVTSTYSTELTNAASSRSQGVELEAQWAVNSAFRLSANVTYLDSYFVNFPNAQLPVLESYCGTLNQADFAATPQCSVYKYPIPSIASLTGQPTSYAPRWSGSLSASYSLSLPNNYRLTSELRPFFTTNYFQGASNDFTQYVSGHVRWDARVAVESPSGRWGLDLIGKNLNNQLAIPRSAIGLYAVPEGRVIAGQIRYKF
jgi:outer membrane receptor protein involved in Fe transport